MSVLVQQDAQEATAQVLWEAAQLEPRAAQLREALRSADPEAVVALARANGLSGMLWRAVQAACADDVLGDAGLALAEEAYLCRLEGVLLLPHAVSTAVGPLTEAGLEPIIFKGPSLAVRYPEPGLRTMGDLDVIVPSADHPAAVEALRRSGWRVVDPASRNRYETVLVHPSVSSLPLELHRGVDTWFSRSAEIHLEQDLWDVRIPCDIMGTPCFGLPTEVLLVALAAHAGKPHHTFSRLIWIVDLMVVARDGVDWDEVGRLATRWRCRTILAVALRLGARLGMDAPAELMQLRGSSVRLGAICPVLDESWPVHGPYLGDRTRLRYALADRWTRRLVLFAGSSAPAPWWEWPHGYAFYLKAAAKWVWARRRDRTVPAG